MKTCTFTILALYLLICLSTNQVRGDDAQEASNEEEEEVGPCGPVPNHGQMMAVLKPMSHIVVCAVNQIMDYGVLLRDLQGVMENICITFDACVPSGKLANNKATNPEVKCIMDHCFKEVNKEKVVINSTTYDLIFNCFLHPLLPLQKQHIWSVIHWVLQMTNM